MKTILPSYFVFSRANSLYQEPIAHIIEYKQITTYLIIALAILVLFIILFNRHLNESPQQQNDDKYDSKTKKLLIVIATACVPLITLFFTPPYSRHLFNVQNQAYNDYGFKMANTNLIVIPTKLAKSDEPFAYTPAVTSHWVNQTQKNKRAKYALYANPRYAKIKIKKDSDDPKDSDNSNYISFNNKYYLGTMDHGKFEPAQSHLSAIFANYQKYIVQNHLENHFKNKMVFAKSKKYLTPKYKPSLVLIGDNDYTLHLTYAKKITDRIDNDKITAN